MISFKQHAKHANGTYASLKLSPESSKQLNDFISSRIASGVDPSSYHCTLMYSRVPVPQTDYMIAPTPISTRAKAYEIFPSKDGKKCLVLLIDSQEVYDLHQHTMDLGASYDYPEYKPHVTLAADHDSTDLPLPDFDLIFDRFEVTPLDTDKVTTNESVSPLSKAETALLAGDHESALKHLSQHVQGKSLRKDAHAARLRQSIRNTINKSK
jgi:AraC-like DNA-binding protein